MTQSLLDKLFGTGGPPGAGPATGPAQQPVQQPVASPRLTPEERQALIEEVRATLLREMFELVTAASQPNTSPLNERFRDLPALRWNVKALGADLAARHFGRVAETRQPLLHDAFATRWQPTRFNDFLQAWFLEACAGLQMAPVLHRKVWEEAWIVNTLRQAGMLQPGKRGIVFGVGQERMPSYIAAHGAEVLATDLAPDAAGAQDWIETAQHGSLERLYHGQYLPREAFDARVRFCHADMNDISAEFDGQFDFCWSICAFEHLGSIEQGLRFVEQTARLLKPGGISAHTTEFSYTDNERTIDHWPTVLFRRRDFEALAARLRAQGLELPPIDFDVGQGPVDFFVDLPPYPQHGSAYYQTELSALHLKLMVDGFPCTCYGVTFRKPAA